MKASHAGRPGRKPTRRAAGACPRAAAAPSKAAGPASLAGEGGAPAPRGCTNFRLRQLTRRVTQHFDHIVGAAGLKTTQYSLLSHLEHLGPVRPGELARAMAMDPSTLTRNLQPLVKLGWAEVGPGDDGRSRVVRVTAAGRAKRAEAARQWKRAQLEINARLGDARVVRLHELLDECLRIMDPESGEPA